MHTTLPPIRTLDLRRVVPQSSRSQDTLPAAYTALQAQVDQQREEILNMHNTISRLQNELYTACHALHVQSYRSLAIVSQTKAAVGVTGQTHEACEICMKTRDGVLVAPSCHAKLQRGSKRPRGD